MSRAPSPVGTRPWGFPASRRARQSARGVRGGEVDLEAVLARVARAGDEAALAHHGPVAVPVVLDGGQVQPRHEGLEDLQGPGPLDGDLGRLRALVGDLRVEPFGLRQNPGEVLVRVGGVHHEQVAVVGVLVDEHVVHEAALGGEEAAVLDLVQGQLGGVVAGEELDQVQGLGALDPDLSHVAHVEESGLRADRHVLVDDRGVLHGHVPPAEVHHLRPQRAVFRVEGGFLQVVHGPPP